ncbi:hypothetical protein ACQPZG_31805 [Streptomyces sp. CA-294286]|uniref:hypothetical protein n=1 Tax=Streptomyces sp. CA-294286 TaxID=3240070 RepID=UPI003D90D17C
MTANPPVGPASAPPHLFDELQDLLPPLRAMLHRHQEVLDQYRDPEGYVIEDKQRAYEDARWDTALEASDTLVALVSRLEQLVPHPPRRAFTLAVTGPAHHEVDDVWLFVVDGTDVTDAWQSLSALPVFRQWAELEYPTRNGVLDQPTLLPHSCHAGIAAPGMYTDLRQEQARTATVRIPAPIAPDVPPRPAGSRRPR